MKIIVSGGSGAIAQAIKSLLSKDYEVLTPGRDELDVLNWNQIKIYMEKHKPDILINNAGSISPQTVVDAKFWEFDIRTNLFGTYYCCQYALINNPNCNIINIGSSSAYTPKGGWSSYCCSKTAIQMLTNCLILENHKAYCLNIGRSSTPMRKALFGEENNDTLLEPKDIAIVIQDIILEKHKPGVINFTKEKGLWR